MSCLLPQFKCLPDTFSFHSKTNLQPNTTQPSKSRELIYFRTQCVTSTASPPTSTATMTVIDMEKLRLLCLEAHSKPAAADRPLTYIGTVGLPKEVNFEASFAAETLVTSEEATIVAAAAEAVALAKAAVKVAKDAAMMVSHNSLTISDGKSAIITSEADTHLFNRAEFAEISQIGVAQQSTAAVTGLGENFPLLYPIEEDDSVPTNEELELLQTQMSNSIAVRSSRQTERKAKRANATEKAAAKIVSVKSGSRGRKKRTSVKSIDHSDPLRYLRRTTSGFKLLTAPEERKLSEGIQDLLKLEKLQDELAERCGEQPSYAQWAAAAGVDQKTLRDRVNYGIQCKDKMVKSNVRLVISVARKYQETGMSIQDLVQEGCRGLVRGAEKFDASKGFKFSTYAHWWIKQAIRKFLSEQSRTIRLPIHMVEAAYKVKSARQQLYNKNGRHPNNEEIAVAAGITMRRLEAVLLLPKAPQSLDQYIGSNTDIKPSEVISDPQAETSEEIVTKQFMKDDLEKVLDTLNPREKKVIRLRFGLEDGRMKTLHEIGDVMGVSRERIRQIETCAMRKLKSKKRTKHLQQYYLLS